MDRPHAADPNQQVTQFSRFLRIQAGSRFVEQEQLRVGGQRTCQLNAALQAIGETPSRRVRQVSQTYQLQQPHGTLPRLSFLATGTRQRQDGREEAVGHPGVTPQHHIVQN
jgi:hypothetical protein